MELMKNIVAGGKEIGKKILKPAIGVTVAVGTTAILALIGKKARAEETEPEEEVLDETTEGTEEEQEEDETEEDEEA